MMKKILFFSSQDTNRKFNYNADYDMELHHLGGNSGNMVFTNATQSYIDLSNNGYDITYDINKLNKKDTHDLYSCCIVNCSNWLRPAVENFLQRITEALLQTKIPVYFIGLGTQSLGNSTFSDFDKDFIKIAQNFVGAVVGTGGTFGLRGNYTAEFFNYLGFPNAYTVTGCPSMYQMGKDLEVSNEKVSQEMFSPFFNGDKIFKIPNIQDVFNKYEHSEFIDQDTLSKILKFPNVFSEADMRTLLTHPDAVLELLANDRVQLFTNIRNWIDFIKSKNYNFSFGSRFHGTVVPILCGIPSVLLTHDSRTKELSDFFKIPTIDLKDTNRNINLYDEYLKIDYNDFNKNYPLIYSNFETFIKINNIPIKLPVESTKVLAPKYDDYSNVDDKLKSVIQDYLNFKPLVKLPNLDRRKQFIIKHSFKLIK